VPTAKRPDFLAGSERLVVLATERAVTVVCSETLWRRCHRRLLADHLTLIEASMSTTSCTAD